MVFRVVRCARGREDLATGATALLGETIEFPGFRRLYRNDVVSAIRLDGRLGIGPGRKIRAFLESRILAAFQRPIDHDVVTVRAQAEHQGRGRRRWSYARSQNKQ